MQSHAGFKILTPFEKIWHTCEIYDNTDHSGNNSCYEQNGTVTAGGFLFWYSNLHRLCRYILFTALTAEFSIGRIFIAAAFTYPFWRK